MGRGLGLGQGVGRGEGQGTLPVLSIPALCGTSPDPGQVASRTLRLRSLPGSLGLLRGIPGSIRGVPRPLGLLRGAPGPPGGGRSGLAGWGLGDSARGRPVPTRWGLLVGGAAPLLWPPP